MNLFLEVILELKDIKAIIDLMNKNGLTEFEIERPEFKMRLKKGSTGEFVAMSPAPALFPAPIAAPTTQFTPPTPAQVPAPADDGTVTIKAPMVGTFYLASSPEVQPFVQVGSEIQENSVVCIIEAMKMMNEIKAEVRGTVVAVLWENGKPVEFGSPLFRIKPA